MSTAGNAKERYWFNWKLIVVEVIFFVGLSAIKAHWVLSGTYLATTNGTLANLMLLLFAASLVGFLPTPARRGCFLCMVAAISAFLFSDIVHYRALRDFVSLSELGHATQLASGLATIGPYIRWWDF